MLREIKLGNRMIGDGHPTYVVGEVGINHNGDMEIAKELIRAAKENGLDAVKFQKRTPELCVPDNQKNQMRETPWGYISYLDYRYKVEFNEEQYWRLILTVKSWESIGLLLHGMSFLLIFWKSSHQFVTR